MYTLISLSLCIYIYIYTCLFILPSASYAFAPRGLEGFRDPEQRSLSETEVVSNVSVLRFCQMIASTRVRSASQLGILK